MGLDIYAGTLTRYYARNWKTVVEKWAEENGYRYSRIEPGEEEEQDVDPAVIQKAIHHWQDAVTAFLGREGILCRPWREDNIQPYYTDKPDFDAFGALLLYAAGTLYGKAIPKTVRKNWNYEEDALILRAMQDPEVNWSLFAGTEWWLPWAAEFYFTCPDPVEQKRVIATTGALSSELNKINESGWRADEETICSWSGTEGYPADSEMENGGLAAWEEKTEYNTESLAKFAFSVLYQSVLFSKKHHVPILLDC